MRVAALATWLNAPACPIPTSAIGSWSQVMPPKKKGRGAPRGNDNVKKNKEPEPVRALAAPTMPPP